MIPWYLSRYIVESLETDLKFGFLFTPHCYDTFYSAGQKNCGRYLLDFPERASTVLLIINLILVLQPIFCGMIITLISGIRPINGTNFLALFLSRMDMIMRYVLYFIKGQHDTDLRMKGFEDCLEDR